jgi:hypothetical protein
MPPKKCARPRSDRSVRKVYPANPLWPLQELRDLRNFLFVPDPEFVRFELNALSDANCRREALSSKEASRCHSSKHRHLGQTQFPVPPLVKGLPWRFAKDITTPVVPDPDFVPFELSSIARR